MVRILKLLWYIFIVLTASSRSQSRMKGEYLFYEEKVETTEEEKQAKAARRFVFRLPFGAGDFDPFSGQTGTRRVLCYNLTLQLGDRTDQQNLMGSRNTPTPRTSICLVRPHHENGTSSHTFRWVTYEQLFLSEEISDSELTL